ncbi:hypothetical protein LFL96_36760 (plasmid) [Paraburkholderia sp. D15]|uniref:hypothetical protein n=1 Tax=Paraburkholderia sp. D15 TaxID=2880218 RepID=UPI00247ABBC1|nr:hypothetical protein [Paraburkholderia sp. D15]WGS55030.1 hypothetical protein LFL96_36760 [Paraburkholderia sp. D15]
MNDEDLQREKKRLGQSRESWSVSSPSPELQKPMAFEAYAAGEQKRPASQGNRESNDVVVLRQRGILSVWLWCILAGVFAGAAVIGADFGRGVSPWSNLQAVKEYAIAPVLLLLLIYLERETGGNPLRLVGKIIFPIVVAMAFGWCAVALGIAQRLAHLVSA